MNENPKLPQEVMPHSESDVASEPTAGTQFQAIGSSMATSEDNSAEQATGQTPDAVAEPTLLEQMGGFSGLVSSTLPILVLIPVNNRMGLIPALGAALAVALAIFVWRLARKENLQPAFSGLFGVAIGAGIAWATGDAKGYFLYGIWMSLALGIVFLISVLIRWPAVGVIWRGINGEGMEWRKIKKALIYYDIATVGWALVFFTRFFVQNFYYNADNTNSLAIAKLLMGWPLTGVVTLLTIWAVRKANAIAVTAATTSHQATTTTQNSRG